MPTDRRVRYTKMFLRESLIKLLKEKPIARITVTELCADAEVNRATYYTYYTDQFDHLQQIEQEFIGSITTFLDGLAAEGAGSDAGRTVERILEFADANRDLSRVLLGRHGNIDFLQNLIQLLRARVFAVWGVRRVPDATTADYLYTFVAEGSLGVVRQWLFDDAPTKSPREVAALIRTIAEEGLGAYG